jgi:hypothetical protein
VSTHRNLVVLSLVGALVGSCLPPQEDPTYVKDLRVLGMSFDPPDVLIPGCTPALLLGLAGAADGGQVAIDPRLGFAIALASSRPLAFKALIADPAGNGRMLDYRLLGCANTGDRNCDNEGDYVEMLTGQTTAGELALTVTPGTQILPDGVPSALSDAGTPLLIEVINQDTWKGLGGIRVPVVLDLKAADTGEHIYAQKLMVYACQFFPVQKPNVLPVLPGVTWNGEAWAEAEVKEYQGTDPVTIEPVDFTDLQESYWVPSLQLQPVPLQESWKVNYLTTFGTMSAYGTGGTDFSGTTGRHRSKWQPSKNVTEARDVRFWFVVRDGRGGESWISRQAHWTP